VLLGEFRHSIDAKNRVFLPAKWREEFGEKVFITVGLDRCLYLMPSAEWEERRAQLDALPLEDPQARSYVRLIFSKASEETVDGQGRITIPPSLKQAAGLEKEVVLAGSSRRAEIWDRATFDAYQDRAMAEYEQNAQRLR
jgi:MraZ protein